MPVVVTGAGGWLGQTALEMLDSALGDGFDARVKAFGSRQRVTSLRSGRMVETRPLDELASLNVADALVCHFAFLTREHAAGMDLAEYVAENRRISWIVQEFLGRCGAAGVFMPSSGAVYASADIAENPYGVLKREDEELFAGLGRRLGFPTAIMRVFNLAGPFINKLDSYALACIVSDVLNGGPVRLRAAHPVWRGYAHVGDVLNIGLGCLLRRQNPGVFDSAGEAIELGDLAVRVARALAGREIEILRPDWRDGPPNRYLGHGEIFGRLADTLGIGLHGLDEQILDTADYIRSLAARV